MLVRTSIAPGAFEPEAIAAMSEALETACELLRDAGEREVARATRRIISAARSGEHDPIQLRAAALAGCRNWLKPTSAPFRQEGPTKGSPGENR